VIRLAAFEWKAGASKHIVYVGTDDHLHELSFTQSQGWSHADLNQSAPGAPSLPDSAIPTAYDWNSMGTKQVCYTTDDGHIHELFRRSDPNGEWAHADLTQMAKAPIADPLWTLAGFEWRAGGTKQVAFVDKNDHHIHELSVPAGGTWGHTDISGTVNAKVQSLGNLQPLVGYEWEPLGRKQIVFGTVNDNHLHMFSLMKGQKWTHTDLTASSAAPTNWPDNDFRGVCGFEWAPAGLQPIDESKNMVCYSTSQFELHLLTESRVPGSLSPAWSHQLLTPPVASSKAISSAPVGYQWSGGQSQQIAFTTNGGQIHEFFKRKGGAWQYADLTSITGGGGDANFSPALIAAYQWEAGATKQVVFGTADGHIHELVVAVGGKWKHHDLMKEHPGFPAAKP